MASALHARLGTRWLSVCKVVKERDGYLCQQCGTDQDLTVDHIYPLSRMTPEQWDQGLPWDTESCITLCRTCNGRKREHVNVRQPWFNTRWLDHI